MTRIPTRGGAFATYMANVVRHIEQAEKKAPLDPPLTPYEQEVVGIAFQQAQRVDHCATAISAMRALTHVLGGGKSNG